MTLSIAIIGLGGRGQMFADLAATTADLRIVALADRDPQRLATYGERFGVAAANRFTDWSDLAASNLHLDAVVIATWDKAHVEPTCAFLKRGSHVLLEKPMATDFAGCRAIVAAQQASGRFVSICHSMRYQGGFARVKALVDAGRIGRLVSIDLVERVAFWHQAHSYVRGNAATLARSAPMILTKSCHDLDWLCHLVGAPALRLSSFGALTWFRSENAPPGAPARCSDGCPHEKTCTYSALRCYVDTTRRSGWPANMCSPNDHSREAHLKAIQEGPYGRCVWRCDNDVIDHQVVAMEFPGQVTATFTVAGLSSGGGRLLRLHGSQGDLVYDQGKASITITPFAEVEPEHIDLTHGSGGHGGGDNALFAAFIAAIREQNPALIITSAQAALESHALAFAAEASRHEGRQVELARWLDGDGNPT